MPDVRIDEKLCKGCSICVDVCPVHIIELKKDELNTSGYHPAYVKDIEKCILCTYCGLMCPDTAIEIWK
ncbi:MAG: 4Fe-4S binding protein [Caldisericia bacterium]|jgi:2-oxoglutarate ferredoxin oxidoreductase subunit delta|nr:4Fe-4S binding protein [Caldisericia bacterium]MDD5689401.1 4Fe-4S binding protein [Caldisericia bacterium]HOJ16406.1 4Fe-4S binding protein [Caldisericia bacterium]HOW02923.1 4Fe-4S binding protein [Caldisericia bacterium]HPO29065.1 4Fe-4S binding protein [Caldisericia bacterium]